MVVVQFNVSLMRWPYSSPAWDTWKNLLPVVHAEAKKHPGFIDNLDGSDTDLGYLAPYPGCPIIMGNLSAWQSSADLMDFTFGGVHGKLLKHRAKWFLPWPTGVVYAVTWESPQGSALDPEDAVKRLDAAAQRRNPTHTFTW